MAKRKLEENDISTIEEDEFKSFSDREEQIEEHSNGRAKHVEDKAQGSGDDSASEDEGEEEKEEQPPNKKQKKQLSAQDVQVARETAELFKSNIFKLQIDELMKEVKVKKAHEETIDKVLHRLHDLIKQVPPVEDLTLQQAEQHFNPKKLVIPFPDPKPTKVNYKFSYLPSEDLSLVGSYGLKTAINQPHGQSIEVALTMPKELFQPKDYLNYRALYKKSFYLAYLGESLIHLSKKNNLPIKVSYHFFNDDVLNPVLKIESIQTENPEDLTFTKTKIAINLIVAFPFGVFDSKKLLPDKNCIRVQSDTETLPPTPLYNSSVLSQTSYDYYLKYLYTTKKSADAFKDACVLGKLWLQQRGFNSSLNNGGFGHFEFAILMSALLNGGGLNGNKILLHGFSSYQLFKGTIKYLATMDLNEGYLSLSSLIGENIVSKYKSDGFNVPTIFDKNTKLNILWKMNKSSYKSLQLQAQQTLELLNDVVKDRFDAILLQKSDFDPMRYDIVFKLSAPEELYDSFGPLEKIAYITFENYFKSRLFAILNKALGERTQSIVIRNEHPSNTFAIHKRKPSHASSTFVIGLQLNPEECDKLVTKGPNNEDKDAGIKFRSFWGNKASLRRFKDGSIQHCVVWNIKDQEPVVMNIIKYALDTHLQSEISQHLASSICYFDKKLPVPLLPSATNQVVTSLGSFTALRNSFENLSKVLTNLELPLSVKTVLPASSGLRYTSVLQPVPFAASNPDFWNDCVLQFETSTRWPDELSALEKTKSAFLLKICEELAETEYNSFITKDESVPFNENITLLNILTPEGYGFRIRAFTERDELLYLRAVSNADKQKALVQDVYLKFNEKYMGSVKHTRSVTHLAQHFHFYSPTVRLFKQWLDSQLLLQHFSEELVELIALKPFVDPAPYSIPHSVENGFLQILNFLANWNWKEDPLVLDLVKSSADDDVKLSDKLTIQAHRIIEQNFEKIRKTDPSGIKTQYFIGSKDDPSGILWSHNLTLPISTRLTALSRAAIQLLRKEGITETNLDLIFTPALQDYDFTIKVKANNITTSSGILPPNTFKNLIQPLTSFPDDITTKYDLVQGYVDELNKKFGNAIIFSNKKFTGLCKNNENVIGGIFVPTNLTKKKFRVNLGINVKPFEDKGDEVIINTSSIYDEIELLGGDLITAFDKRK
ncbi:nucleolar RNA-associated proteins, putative [Candida dubliniensis CD36]|uniref:U3 small nucleolar RNA-associated protein 22 n=1 Tax=Candida dubliniensis (strain CD36 / ATCC MYA-646 / CBS 7987 / NCPF 3949 / NRRL Y-17841) TaxID=573826 RepID=B9WAS2_CANDC|nr:nucleolar RNA-associated proteins, putative [Candida dubliniensis CD36]CAX43492.1 nucleolar RNA-associated proteins, putative [Candida dubliniensis CD36]